MNLDLDREVTAVNRSSRPVDGDLGSVAVGWPYAVFQVRKPIRRVDFVLHSITVE